MADLTIGESEYLRQLGARLARLRAYLDGTPLPDDATPDRWYCHIADIRAIQSNISNDLSFIATCSVRKSYPAGYGG